MPKSVSKRAGLAACLWAASALAAPAAAVPILGYQGQLSPGVAVGGAVESIDDPSSGLGYDFWSFAGTAGSVITITGHRAEPGFDMYLELYEGTGADTDDLFFLASADDEVPAPPGLDGPFADPQLLSFMLPSTGLYTIMVLDAIGDADGGDGLYAYTLLAEDIDPAPDPDPDPTDVPEPASLLLFGIGLACLGIAHRPRARSDQAESA